ncbi:7 transmembrane receptor (rhodopsin family) domain-containing protein [Ditylenchus destructor]|uniref:7 transmembrane receptor (Rhodopsin family) domain-containing protein n=1 Tax=Ditylenchus destructor TaxID=166010 RepID=A0AAD4MUQ0_9BILA|nr:7 transmembrane receptor (rhodopsin family) domain-containing protein [Ditylenchus destructor]
MAPIQILISSPTLINRQTDNDKCSPQQNFIQRPERIPILSSIVFVNMLRNSLQSTSRSPAVTHDSIKYITPSEIVRMASGGSFYNEVFYDCDYEYEDVFILDYRREKGRLIVIDKKELFIKVVTFDAQKLIPGRTIKFAVDSYDGCELFEKVGDCDLVVLMGDDGINKTYYQALLPENSPTRIMLEGLKQLQSSRWKQNPVIMEGGFNEWMKNYPQHTKEATNYMPVPNEPGSEKVEQIEIKENEEGFTFERIFGKCLVDTADKTLTAVTIEDPFIINKPQFSNFVAFCELLVSRKKSSCKNLVSISLVTRPETKQVAKSKQHALRELSQSLTRRGIALRYFLNNNNFYCSSIISVLNTIIFMIEKYCSNEGARAALNTRRSVVKMLILCVAIFYICYSMLNLMALLQSLGVTFDFPEDVKLWMVLLVIFGSSVNPFIYALFSVAFRKRLKKLLCNCHCFCKRKIDAINS